jgi:hypothetical protein
MRFGVDHGNSPGSNRDVVDVRAAVSRDAPVVQQLDPVPMQELGESGRGAHLAGGALLPGLGALGLIGHADDQCAETAESLAGVLFAKVLAAGVFARRARAGLPLNDRGLAGIAAQARSGFRRSVPDGLVPDRQVVGTDHAAVGPA